jgi:pantetheine-phosphate adenylyltransferase
MKKAIYPGSFDPITNGHIDIIERATRLFDTLVVAVLQNPAKNTLFSASERVGMIREAVMHLKGVEVEVFDGLLVEFAKKVDASIIVRGLRAISDFDYEFQMALINKKLYPHLETVFMMTAEEHLYLSSSVVKELASFGAPIHALVPANVANALQKRLSCKDTSA